MDFSKNGSGYISSKIGEAITDGSRRATVSGAWEIAEEIRLPSDFTLVLENAHLKMADGVYSNMFVNENHGRDIGRTSLGTDRNITILGIGEAILDGGRYNGLSERNQLQNGLPPIWKNNLLLFTNVDGFKISGISCRNQRWWALNFIYCRNGYLGDIDFCANDLAIDSSGREYHGLKREKYEEILVKNADGIDLRCGCHDILIENITGFTEDDSVALTALAGRLEASFSVEGLEPDIFNVTVRNVRTAALCSNVRLLNQGEIKLHDVTLDGIYDLSADSAYMDRGAYAVRIGDTRIYGTRHSNENETYNITVKNVVGGGDYVISVNGGIGNLNISDIKAINGAGLIRRD